MNHALVFGVIGLLLGIAITSCACMSMF